MKENIITYIVIGTIFISLSFISIFLYIEDYKLKQELEMLKEELEVVNKSQKKEFIESFFKKEN